MLRARHDGNRSRYPINLREPPHSRLFGLYIRKDVTIDLHVGPYSLRHLQEDQRHSKGQLLQMDYYLKPVRRELSTAFEVFFTRNSVKEPPTHAIEQMT